MSERLYAARPTRLHDGSYVVVTGRSPWTRFLMESGVLGDQARWWTSPARPRSMQREVNGEEIIIPGRWPFGMKMIAGPKVAIVTPGALGVIGGWLLTMWAIWRSIRWRP